MAEVFRRQKPYLSKEEQDELSNPLNQKAANITAKPDGGIVMMRYKDMWFPLLISEDKIQTDKGNALERAAKNVVFFDPVLKPLGYSPYVIFATGGSMRGGSLAMPGFKQLLPILRGKKPLYVDVNARDTVLAFQALLNEVSLKPRMDMPATTAFIRTGNVGLPFWKMTPTIEERRLLCEAVVRQSLLHIKHLFDTNPQWRGIPIGAMVQPERATTVPKKDNRAKQAIEKLLEEAQDHGEMYDIDYRMLATYDNEREHDMKSAYRWVLDVSGLSKEVLPYELFTSMMQERGYPVQTRQGFDYFELYHPNLVEFNLRDLE
jgi:hypothetical protein